jgi:hypothetical protein
MKKQIQTKTIKRVLKAQAEDKMSRVLREFKEGKLRDQGGNIVTDHKQAIAIGLSESGLTDSSLKKAEIRNKLKVCRSALQNMLYRERSNSMSIKAEILKLFRQPSVKDTDVHALAERLQMKPDEMEGHIYSILREFIGGGLSKGKIEQVDPKELAEGIKVEAEHTDDINLREKIARDHLAENPNYYSKLKTIEGESK